MANLPRNGHHGRLVSIQELHQGVMATRQTKLPREAVLEGSDNTVAGSTHH